MVFIDRIKKLTARCDKNSEPKLLQNSLKTYDKKYIYIKFDQSWTLQYYSNEVLGEFSMKSCEPKEFKNQLPATY